MSAAWSRDRLVEALGRVEGITAAESAPDVPAPGSAWPKWVESRYQLGKLTQPLVHAFDVLVVLPAGYDATTVEAADKWLPALMHELALVASVDVAEPVQLTYPPNASTPALRIRATPRPERISRHA
jgi:hypothetical protein